MAKFQSPLLGYNNNVRHKNRVFHIQTEDSGVNHPHIITHLFMDGGRILKSVKQSYAEHVGAEKMNDTVRGLMKEQHKAMFIALRDGQFDYLVEGGPVPPAVAAAAAATAAAAAATAAEKTAAAATAAATAAAAATEAVTAPEIVAGPTDAIEIPLVSQASIVTGASAPPTSPDPPRADIELAPNTIDDSKRPVNPSVPPPASQAKPRVAEMPPPPPAIRELASEEVPTTTRQPADARPDAVAASARSPSGRELTLDFDALERAAQDAVSPSLFHSSDLPPPPKNLFAKEPGTGGAYRAVEADPRHEPRHDAREEAGGRSFATEEPGSRAGRTIPPASTRGDKSPQPSRVSTRAPASRPAEARYAPARPAAIFGSTQRPQPQSLFSDELVSDKSLDEVILSYLAEDLEPPRRK